MKFRHMIKTLGLTSLMVISSMASAQISGRSTSDHSASEAEHAELQAGLEAEHQATLAEAEQQRNQAMAAVRNAREQLHVTEEQRRQDTAATREARAAQQAELARRQEEIRYAHRQLQETSRELSRVNRELARAKIANGTHKHIYRTGASPVIGVIIGESVEDVGVKVLGVSPDGPSERAGIEAGDVIVALGGVVLAAADESGDPRAGLNHALAQIVAGEPVIVSVERDDQTLDLTITPEVREPLGWESVVRFPSSPGTGEKTIVIEQIEVPEIDTAKLAEQIEQMKIDIDGRRLAIEAIRAVPDIESLPRVRNFEFDLEELSELGNIALHDAHIWFGLPLTQGLKLAEVDPALGEYFKTDRGVLVLKARADNDLQLQTGDVILGVGDTEVNSPSEFMRAFREFDPGDQLDIDIKRERRDKTLTITMPERQAHLVSPDNEQHHAIRIIRNED